WRREGEDGRATVGQEPNRPSVLGLARPYDDDDDDNNDNDPETSSCLPGQLAGVALESTELYDYCADRYPPHGGGEPMGLCFSRNSG
ncbi:hypothetical protein CP532_2549, partial [Ophiocordyceps camponoti-leonardi (nom. inval.)]